MKYAYENHEFPDLKALKGFLKDLKYKHPLGRILLPEECVTVMGLFTKFGADLAPYDLVFSEQRILDFGGRQLFALHSRTGEEQHLSVKDIIKTKNYRKS